MVAIRHLYRFIADWRKYQRRADQHSLRISLPDLYPILNDYDAAAGNASGHYFHQDLWAARKIFETRPSRHVDIGSRIDGFIAHLLTFMPVEVIDIRPLQPTVTGLKFIRDDATELREFEDGSLHSISSLHAAEHFGLGRYGDAIDPRGFIRFAGALQRVLAPGGQLYFSVPIGRERLEFNAHRVFAPGTVIAAFPKLRLREFAYVDDSGRLCEREDFHQVAPNTEYGCGLFEFVK